MAVKDDKKVKAKTKTPTAIKRVLQNEVRRQINKAFKTRVRTAVRAFETSLEKGESAEITTTLNTVFSMMDKGVKRSVFKRGTADRTKSRFTARAKAKIA